MKSTTPCLPRTPDSRLPVSASNPRTAPEPSICLGRGKISPGRPSGSGAGSDGDTDAIASIEQSRAGWLSGGLSCGNGSPYTTDNFAKLSVRPTLWLHLRPPGPPHADEKTKINSCAYQVRPTPQSNEALVQSLGDAWPLSHSDAELARLLVSGPLQRGGVAQSSLILPQHFWSSI